jgi:hypothetical protein
MFEGKTGEFVNTDTTDISISEIEPAEHSQKQVVILANRRTASFFNFGCKNYKLMMPTWRSMRLPDYPIDNISIQPDIYPDKSVKG